MDQEIRYKILSIDLGTAHTKEEYKIPGYNLNVLALDGSATLRLNHVTGDAIDLTLIDQIQSKFGRFYITNSAQSGKTLILAIGQHNFKLINDPIPGYQLQDDEVFSQANPVSGQKYTVLDTVKNARIKSISAKITWATTQPTPLEVHLTIDGKTITHTFTDPVSATEYIAFNRPDTAPTAQGFKARDEADDLTAPPFLHEGKSIKIEAEITWATTQPTPLQVRVKWAKKVKR